MKIVRTTYLSLGSNKGNKQENLQQAIYLISQKIGTIAAISSIYQTASWGFDSEDFYNICIKVNTTLNPEELLEKTQMVEKYLGRVHTISDTYEDRTIDIDVLFFDDEVIFSKDLIVPHPKMLERKFVLVPLAEIEPNFLHPIKKQKINQCVAACTDSSEIVKLEDLELEKPVSLADKYNYIAIEGNIGAGKTTLSKMISDDFNARLVLERFADNPFLPKFYEDKDRYAFQTEMTFLTDRYQQLSDDLAQFDMFKNFIVSDYYIFKSLIFSQITLQQEEYRLYRKVFDIMYKEITKPDLYVYLYQNTDRLLENIKKRGRDYEQNIASGYLEKIHKGYANFMQAGNDLNTIIIDVSELDFVSNPDDYSLIIKKLTSL
ncbi:2-amino-4-hydroxy-6-hydroxymethyldihydropteridine diphosphokinase [Aureivirga sp. CE67]|uniref:2-amino-4-hydroxy-6- hydroxymethyldihydropteridine diphosphokinase n=1 Tax=Aureivirga sp. CE67 TaxID=1788983 RepID=UPI0018C9038F|nr:2-amino-4-hydroxy-6-hydroxymethyldihydropteridine diphosphokinase [Aureivirga sp. CE67]